MIKMIYGTPLNYVGLEDICLSGMKVARECDT